MSPQMRSPWCCLLGPILGLTMGVAPAAWAQDEIEAFALESSGQTSHPKPSQLSEETVAPETPGNTVEPDAATPLAVSNATISKPIPQQTTAPPLASKPAPKQISAPPSGVSIQSPDKPAATAEFPSLQPVLEPEQGLDARSLSETVKPDVGIPIPVIPALNPGANLDKAKPSTVKPLTESITASVTPVVASATPDSWTTLPIESHDAQDEVWRRAEAATSPVAVKQSGTARLPKLRKNKPSPPPAVPDQVQDFTTFPIGLAVDRRLVVFSVLVRGQEDGVQAVAFDHWQLPFGTVVDVLNFKTQPLADGRLELRSPYAVNSLDLSELPQDPELGLVLSIAEIRDRFGVTAEFDLNEYAINLITPQRHRTKAAGFTTFPVQVEGLPLYKPTKTGLTAVEQRLVTSGLTQGTNNIRGELQAVGTLAGGSWYVRASQRDLANSRTWQLSEAQYLYQTELADYAIGSQRPFWPHQTANYWGLTTLLRQGFTPPEQYSGGFNATQRLQANQIGQTIVGEAEPGTLVQLTQGFSEQVIDEVLVDSSGLYRFEDVPVQRGSRTGNYRLLLFPDGRLAAAPEIRPAVFSTVAGQLPPGATATIASIGGERNTTTEAFWGELTEIQGGLAQRWGLSEQLTLGIGAIYDDQARALGEVFFQGSTFPIEVSARALTPDKAETWDVDAQVLLRPMSNLSLRLNTDRFSRRASLNWQVSPGLSVLGDYNNRDGLSGGIQWLSSSPNQLSFVRATVDDANQWRWNLRQRWGDWQIVQQGNEVTTLSDLEYNLSGYSPLGTGHTAVLSYQTRAGLNGQDSLWRWGWRYRSPEQAPDGLFRWEAAAQYGAGSQGSGLLLSLQATVLPGILVRGRYEGISVTSDRDRYTLELLTTFNLQNGFHAGDRRAERFRVSGGVMLRPFLDANNNRVRDRGEDWYTAESDLLFSINQQSFRRWRPEIQSDRILLRLAPGTYRLDLDPAGFPLDWQAETDAYGIEVEAGSYTTLPIPLIRAYTLTGVVTNGLDEPLGGARVEAIAPDSEHRVLSVTNGAGVYYLEGLQQQRYRLEVNGQPTTPTQVDLVGADEFFQELNLRSNNI